MAKKSKRKNRLKSRVAYRDKLTGRFTKRPARRSKQVKKTIIRRRPKSAVKRGELARVGSRRIFERKIKLGTQSEKISEVVYEIPFELVRSGKRQIFEPSFQAMVVVFDHEAKVASKKVFSTAVCKVNVIFLDDAAEEGGQPGDEEWIQIPIGRRIPVDEPNGAASLYEELKAFLVRYEIWAVNQIQLSILRLPT